MNGHISKSDSKLLPEAAERRGIFQQNFLQIGGKSSLR
jgi:hypothetical protein